MAKQKSTKTSTSIGKNKSIKKSGVGSYINKEGAESSRGFGTGNRPTKKDES